LEEEYHDPEPIISMSALAHEEEYTKIMMQKYKNSQNEFDFFESKLDTLEYAKEDLAGQMSAGVLTEKKYLVKLEKSLRETKALAQQAASSLG
jgi:hypothetical protein